MRSRVVNALENTGALIMVLGTGGELNERGEKSRGSGNGKVFKSEGFPSLF